MSKHQEVTVLLVRLQHELERHGHWQETPPSAKALLSIEPFSVDTLSCTEWLQWIFIPKLRYLIEQNMPLPTVVEISPYVGEALKATNGHVAIKNVSNDIDTLFNLPSE